MRGCANNAKTTHNIRVSTAQIFTMNLSPTIKGLYNEFIATGFKLWYTGTVANRNRVGVLIDKSLKNGVVGLS